MTFREHGARVEVRIIRFAAPVGPALASVAKREHILAPSHQRDLLREII
ncbi:hypothetical protein [Longimicrobium sp.]|nr:hypothetical protein [Longimicrobium sp.]HEX6036630.1 hypothetical protein [Longimicrobium sp.]